MPKLVQKICYSKNTVAPQYQPFYEDKKQHLNICIYIEFVSAPFKMTWRKNSGFVLRGGP